MVLLTTSLGGTPDVFESEASSTDGQQNHEEVASRGKSSGIARNQAIFAGRAPYIAPYAVLALSGPRPAQNPLLLVVPFLQLVERRPFLSAVSLLVNLC
jgi:hypothetical protein